MSTPQPPNQPETSRRDVLLRAHQLNLQHPLVKLCASIDWSYFEQEFGTVASGEVGRPSLPVRLMVGLHYLKALYDESDETVVSKWVENPYWQYFCGEESFQPAAAFLSTRVALSSHQLGQMATAGRP